MAVVKCGVEVESVVVGMEQLLWGVGNEMSALPVGPVVRESDMLG